MFEDEMYIHIGDEGRTFVYSVCHGGELMEAAEVLLQGADLPEGLEEVAPGYYGGSEVMD